MNEEIHSLIDKISLPENWDLSISITSEYIYQPPNYWHLPFLPKIIIDHVNNSYNIRLLYKNDIIENEWFDSKEDSVQYITEQFKNVEEKAFRSFVVHNFIHKEGIGDKTVIKIVNEFDSFKSFEKSTKEQLNSMENTGQITADKIIKIKKELNMESE